jgi:adenylate cyclase
MAEERINRKLAAILAADVVGYSRLMGADEAGTLSALKRHRESVFDPAVAAHNGRIVKLIGDGTIVEFPSVVDAVNCALAVQRSAALPPGPDGSPSSIVLRIGINLGDVIIEGDDIYGDGVNIAARLEPLAEPGGICISSIVNESIGNRIDVRFQDAGDINVKNIERPIRIWRWHPATAEAPKTNGGGHAAPKTVTTSIAILPFTNMSGDPEQEYFSDGITEDIITDLSKIAGLTVIARNSSFTYKGRSVDVRAVGRDLGVKSVLEGSIRRAGNRVRITAQLIDATSGGHLWADRYDRDLTDIFEVQDDVTHRIVDALKVTLSPAEKERPAGGSATVNMEAYDYSLRGRELLLGNPKTRETFEQATALFRKAIEIDPNFAVASAGLGFAYMFDYQNRWSDDPDASLALAKQYAEQAIAKDRKEPLAHAVAAVAATFDGNLERAQSEIGIALSLNPNLAMAYNIAGSIRMYAGQPLEAIPLIERGMRLDPAGNTQYLHFLGMANLLAGKYETAAALLKQRIALVPRTDFSRSALASALGHLGEIEEACRVWRELEEINPKYSFNEHLSRLPFRRKEDAQRLADGLRKAGLLS